MTKKVLCTISLSETDANRASIAAAFENTSRTNLIRRLLLEHLKNHPQKNILDQLKQMEVSNPEPLKP